MKKAISLISWVDMTDGHEYRTGEEFPHDGREIPDKRLAEVEAAGMIRTAEVEEPKKKDK